jgi:hypothetical protein
MLRRRRDKNGRWSLRVLPLIVIPLGVFLGASWQIGWLGSVSAAPARADISPMPVTQVPSTLPAGGVELQNQIVLTPWVSAPSGAMSSDQAITAARVFANAHPYPATALEADVTLPGSIPPPTASPGSYSPIDHVRAWVVTFTSPTPTNVAQGGPGTPAIDVTHYSVAVNAVTGAFVLGFFTP